MSRAPDKTSILSGRSLTLRDLDEVMELLERHNFNKTRYHDLGLRLKLSQNTLEMITKENKDVQACFRSCLASWLRKSDLTKENLTIDILSLVTALKGIGENAVADGINEEIQQKHNDLSKGSEGQIATDQKYGHDGSTLSSLSAEATKPTDQKDQPILLQSSSPDAVKPTDQKDKSTALPSSSDAVKPTERSRNNDQSTLTSSSDAEKPSAPPQLEGNFRRRKSRGLFFKGACSKKKDHAYIETGSSMFIHFKEEKGGSVKFSYDMTACIGVYHRNSLDRVKNEWPDDAESQCCFKVVDKDDAKTLYLVADNQDIAEEWVKELQRHVNMHKENKRKGEFGPNDLEKLYGILSGELETLPWDELGASLGLWDNTIRAIKERCTTDEDCLRECLLHWLKWDDFVDQIGGPTCHNLKEALKFVKKEEIAKKIDEEFIHTKGTETSVQDVKDEDARQKAWARSGKIDQHDQAVATAKKVSCGKMLLDAVTYKMQQNDVGSVLAEICFLSNTMRSSLVTIDNKTSTEIIYHKCFIARGREAHYVGFDRSVAPKSKTSYSFEKYTTLSLEGCAAMICFSATTYESNPTKCFFVVAFRNRLMISNKTALLILNSLESIKELSDSKDYGDIMRNKKDNPVKLKYACKENKYRSTFMWVGCGNMAELKFPFIDFHLYMNNDNYHSHSIITVSHPETNA